MTGWSPFLLSQTLKVFPVKSDENLALPLLAMACSFVRKPLGS